MQSLVKYDFPLWPSENFHGSTLVNHRLDPFLTNFFSIGLKPPNHQQAIFGGWQWVYSIMVFRKLIEPDFPPPGSPATWNMFAALKLRVASGGRAPLFIRRLPGLPVVLGGGNSNIFQPYLGEWSNLTNIFQWGWNHQLGLVCWIGRFCWRKVWWKVFEFGEYRGFFLP